MSRVRNFGKEILHQVKLLKDKTEQWIGKPHLPTQFLRTCTLKEGTVITALIVQLMALLTILVLVILLFGYPDVFDDWCEQKLRYDFDIFKNNENQEMIAAYKRALPPLLYSLMASEGIYFVTGNIVLWAIWKKDVHPYFYLPWLVMSGLLVSANLMSAVLMVAWSWNVSYYRDITIIWDFVPTMMVSSYAVAWAYGFIVSIAHYKRRWIVHWWKHHSREWDATGQHYEIGKELLGVNQQFR